METPNKINKLRFQNWSNIAFGHGCCQLIKNLDLHIGINQFLGEQAIKQYKILGKRLSNIQKKMWKKYDKSDYLLKI